MRAQLVLSSHSYQIMQVVYPLSGMTGGFEPPRLCLLSLLVQDDSVCRPECSPVATVVSAMLTMGRISKKCTAFYVSS